MFYFQKGISRLCTVVSSGILPVLWLFVFTNCLPELASEYSLQQKDLQKNTCIDERGSNGRWVQDWSYAERSNYELQNSYTNWHVASVNFKPTPSQPFRLATSWRWQDYKCPMREIVLQGFCKVAAKLDITRVLILGNSLSIQFGISMLSLLGSPPRGRQTSFNGILKPFTIRCNNFNSDHCKHWCMNERD